MSDILSQEFLEQSLPFTPEFKERYPNALADISETLARIGENSAPALLEKLRQGMATNAEVMLNRRQFVSMEIVVGEWEQALTGNGIAYYNSVSMYGVMDNGAKVVMAAIERDSRFSKGFLFSSLRDETRKIEEIKVYDATGVRIDGQTTQGFDESMVRNYVELTMDAHLYSLRSLKFTSILRLSPPAKPMSANPALEGAAYHR